MARKIVVDLVDAVGTFMAKTNVMSDYIGDLDDLDSTAGSETVNIQYRNLIGNGVGTLTYAISYFA